MWRFLVENGYVGRRRTSDFRIDHSIFSRLCCARFVE